MNTVFSHLPGIAKKTACVAYGAIPPYVKFGNGYRSLSKLLSESQFWTHSELESYQLAETKKLLIDAYENTIHYHALFDRVGFSPYLFNDFSQIEAIPFCTKDEMVMDPESFINQRFKKDDLAIQTTGGSSGKQMRFFAEKNLYNTHELPFVDLIWGRVGYKRERSRVAQLRNAILPKNTLWHFDAKQQVLLIDTYHLTDENMGKILAKLQSRRGNRYVNLMLTMVLGGLWHGAAWTFVVWGALHGAALCVHKVWLKAKPSRGFGVLGKITAILLTCLFVSICWIPFRADSFELAWQVFCGAFTLHDGVFQPYTWLFFSITCYIAAMIAAIIRSRRLGLEKIEGFYYIGNLKKFAPLTVLLVVIGLTIILAYTGASPFIYFQF